MNKQLASDNKNLNKSADICVRDGKIYIKCDEVDDAVNWVEIDNPGDFAITKFIDVKKNADYRHNVYSGLRLL